MPCITAHYFYPQIAAKSRLPVVSLIEESLLYAKKNFPGLKKAGLIASTGTVESKLFHQRFGSGGLKSSLPQAGSRKR